VNLRYLTGMELTAGLLLVTEKKFHLFVDSRYAEKAKNLVRGMKIHDISLLPDIFKKIRKCACEADDVTISRQSFWKRKFPSTKFVHTVGLIDGFRRQKDSSELAKIRKAEKIAKEILRRVPSALRKGLTEARLARQLHMWSLELGADGLSFPPIVAFGTHTSIPHHTPTNRALKRGQIVQIDMGVITQGYCSDLSEVFFTGKITDEQEKAYGALVEARNAARKIAKPGVTTVELDEAARNVLKREGLDQAFTHALGHGIGLEVHEGVTISGRKPAIELLKNEVITIEPGVYFPGKWGMRLESMVYVR
jgi:Xaa-Pro aminopeptidase